jgi:uncharacterized protein
MKDQDLPPFIEDYVRKAFASNQSPNAIAHDIDHILRVRNWAVFIAGREGYSDLLIVEIAALLHDIGRAFVDEEGKDGNHGETGSRIAGDLLQKVSSLSTETIDQITRAIQYHNARPSQVDDLCQNIGEEAMLIQILRDADMMDALGAVGLVRAFTSKHSAPAYDPHNVRGETWELSSDAFTARFDEGTGIGKRIIDQVNFQISFYENLRTDAATRLAGPLIRYMRGFVAQLENEVGCPTEPGGTPTINKKKA